MSDLGDGITAVALPLLVFSEAGIGATSLVFVITALPGLLFGLHAGLLADRFDRKRLVVLSHVARGLLLLSVPLLYNWGGVPAVAALAFLSRSFGVLERPAYSAALPALAGERFQSFLGQRAALQFLAQALGPVAGGALVAVIGAQSAILLDAVSFLLAAVVVVTIPSFDQTKQQRREARAARVIRVGQDLIEGLRASLGHPVARGLLGYWFVSIAAVPIALLAAIPYITVTLGGSSLQYGIAVACYAVGSIVGSVVSGKLSFRGHRRAWLLAAGTTYGAVNLVMVAEPNLLVFCALWVVWGLAYGPEEVIGQMLFAEAVPDVLRGRAYSVLGVVLSVATIIGYAIAGVLIEALGPPRTMVVAGVLFILASTWAFGFSPLARSLQGAERMETMKST